MMNDLTVFRRFDFASGNTIKAKLTSLFTHQSITDIACLTKIIKIFFAFVATCLATYATQATAFSSNKKITYTQATVTPIYQVDLTVTQYELALVQVLAEICPPMLNNRQRVRFARAYQNQLRAFMPTAVNPTAVLRQLSTQSDYRSALNNVRTWTASYPRSENRQLCQEFADMI